MLIGHEEVYTVGGTRPRDGQATDVVGRGSLRRAPAMTTIDAAGARSLRPRGGASGEAPFCLSRAGALCDFCRVRDRSLTNAQDAGYAHVLAAVASVVEDARRAAVRSVNTVMTATYWEIGRRIVEREQAGAARAGYGEALLRRLSGDLTKRFGRGFSVGRLETARLFYLAYPALESGPTSSAGRGAISVTTSRKAA